jgi:diguanylate cyclase (GGDEF)-like protein
MASLRWYLAVLAVVVVALVGGAFLVERGAIDRFLYDDAVASGRSWTEYLASNLTDLDGIAAGKEPSAASRAFLDQAKKVGQVFLFKIYDATGRVRYESDALPEAGTDEEALAAHNSEAAEAIENGQPAIEVKEGTPPTRPPFFSEAYVPYLVGGKVTAVVETYIDQTAKRHGFEAAFLIATAELGFLIAAAFAVPAAAWYLRGRDKQKADARIQYLANYDALTGLANRNQLIRRLERALGGQAGKAAPLAVHCIDIDRFKNINDMLGHDAGDLVIKTVGDRLREVAGPNDIVARLGGDEFAMVQMNPGGPRDAEACGARIVAELGTPYWLNGQEVKLGVRVGIAIAPEHGTDTGRLMKSADLALNKGKAAGAQRICVFSHDLDEELYQRVNIERAIVGALDNDGFVLYFQPLFSLSGDGLVGFEALLRLPTEGGGFIPPATFIPVAEKIGAIDRIGAWVIDNATAAAARWAEHIKVAINLSPLQFATGDVAASVARALKASKLDPGRLEVEITESLLMHDTDAVLRDLAAIKALGVAIVMDDFGTGYSSLSYLWRFPFDKLKIDRSFMTAFEAGDLSARQIIRTIAALGRSLDMRITVEGVETEAQAAFIREIDCDEVQGFYFGRPAPESDVARIILADFRIRAAEEAARRAVPERAVG